jgi:hypothetical protein
MRASALLFALVLVGSSASLRGAHARQAAPPTPKAVDISIELDELPGRNSPGSYWEVSYQLRIADEDAFIRWSDGGENPDEQEKLGIVISKKSFTRRDLARLENLRFSASVPLTGELLERFRNAGRRQQHVWMDGSARIHDAKLGRDFFIKLGPAWGPRRFVTGTYNVQLALSETGELQMSSDNGTKEKTVFIRP